MQPFEVHSALSESSAQAPGEGKTDLDKKARTPKIKVPLDILMSLLRPDELAKLRKYVASYLEKQWQP